MEHQPVGVEQVLQLLVGLGATTEPAAAPVAAALTPTVARGAGPGPGATDEGSPRPRNRRTPSSSSTASSSSNLGFPPLTSPSSTSALSLFPAPSPAPASAAARRRSSLLASLSRSPHGGSSGGAGRSLRRRATFEDLAALVHAQGGTYLGAGVSAEGPLGDGWSAEELAARVRRTMGGKGPARDKDLVNLVAPLTPPQLKALDKAYAAGSAQGLGQGRSLLDVVTGDKAFKGNVEFALRGLLMGPLAWDVWLLQKALDSTTTNETLLIDLLIGREPASLALLRAAYTHRSSSRALSYTSSATSSSTSSTTPTASPSPAPTQPTRSLDVAVLSAFSSNVRLRKAWEVALQGRWEDEIVDDEAVEGDEARAVERRDKLLREDVDQLKVALRRGGNTEIVAKVLLARSPTHLHALVAEYRKSTGGHSSLTKAIKQCVPLGPLQRVFLHAVEGAKNVSGEFGHGVWRDAKAVERAVGVEKGGRRDELLWRLIRLHWDRPRFLAVQLAYKHKYRRPLSDRLQAALPAGALADLATALVASASAPVPQPSVEDVRRAEELEAQRRRARTASESSLASMVEGEEGDAVAALSAGSEAESGSDAGASLAGHGHGRGVSQSSSSEPEAGELEADGELSDPPSPRSPPFLGAGAADEVALPLDGGDAAVRAASPHIERVLSPETPTLPSSVSSRDLARSTSSMSNRSDVSVGHRPSSSLSRTRPSDLGGGGVGGGGGGGHRPPSSAAGSADSSKLSSSLRHARPVAPGRAKRRSEEAARRATSEDPMSPTLSASTGMRSPTPSGLDSRRASLSHSTSSRSDLSFASSTDSGRALSRSASSAPSEATTTFGSPQMQGSIDTSSFFSTPLSPIRDEGSRPSSSFFPNPNETPPPASTVPAFDLSGTSSTDLFGTAGGTPDSPERFFSSAAMRRDPSSQSSGAGSRPSSLFGEGGLDALFASGSPVQSRDGSSGGEQFQQLVRHAQDLARKLRETEARFQASASAYEEEARAELQIKRREEKELRSVDKEHLQQISSLESDISKLTKSLERSREAYDGMKRNYTATCEEAERLRTLVAETRRENRAAEEAMQSHALQVQQFEHDRELLQQAIARLEADLADARRAQDSLDDQKQENLLLKETIDKLRFEIEEMRSVGRKSGFLDGGSAGPGGAFASPRKTLDDSINKSLGREIASQMAAQQENESSEDEEEDTAGEDDVDDIIVTTHRRIKKRGKKSSTATEPTVTHVETSVNVCDADIQTDPVPVREMVIQTDVSAVGDELVKASEVKPEVITLEAPPPPPRTSRQMQEDLASSLGVQVDLVQQFVEAQKNPVKASTRSVLEGRPPATASRSRWRSRLPSPLPHAPAYLVNVFPPSARPVVAQVLDSSVSLICYTASIYLLGMISGSYLLPFQHRHTVAFDAVLASSDYAWEGLALGAAGDGGFAPEGFGQYLYEMIFSSVRTARRIPI
ncbi:uncharacterized protein RHOBADRAFT_50691 [Rhodotorula graminis WP1]|uniref:Annexin n=1 Tax=Rhodotorula graminis (strain WP1) TaxID=578459 RepID=A0A194SC62_RHOGW|nr:uncharacterized protein RHOBADRAFT_50691 [Rhodotorula graminis WP1]KPV78192.1 hypothetical protein RHOBADRAFT_50691 [Rhodotorula graminis WP1]